jgi:ATP phosphoribosyltransferase
MPNTTVLFQRAGDIPARIEEGSADLGITGLDRYLESNIGSGESTLVVSDLGFSKCNLVMAVPDSWIDVISMADLADVSIDMHEKGTDLRVATKFPNLVQRHLFLNGVNYFSLIQSSGTLEAAPIMGFADIISDISSSGTTLRENRLKTIESGLLLSSQACLIGNKSSLSNSDELEFDVKYLLEHIEGYIRSKEFFLVTANIKGDSAEDIADKVLKNEKLSGLRGPTIAKVHTRDGDSWYAVTIVIPKGNLMEVVGYLRETGGSSVTVNQAHYVFQKECFAYNSLLTSLGK